MYETLALCVVLMAAMAIGWLFGNRGGGGHD